MNEQNTTQKADDQYIGLSIDKLDIAIKEITDRLVQVKNMSVEEVATYYVNFREIYDYLDAVRDRWASVKEQLSTVVLPEIFEKSNVGNSITLKSGFRVTVSGRTMVTVTDKENGYKWLKDNNLGDIITENIPWQSISAVAKTMAADNQSLPPEYFKTTVANTTSVTKAKK